MPRFGRLLETFLYTVFRVLQTLTAGRVMMTVRAALTGQDGGASLSDIMQLIGREDTLARLDAGACAAAKA